MQPEPVIAGLIATHHTRRRAELLGRPPADPFDQRQQFGVISPCDPMAGNPVPIRAVQRHQPALLTQFDCNENCATMAGGGRVCGRCLHLTLRWFECGNPTYRKGHAHRPMESTTLLQSYVFSASGKCRCSTAV